MDQNSGNVWRGRRGAEALLEVHQVVENRDCKLCVITCVAYTETGIYTIRTVRDCRPTYRMCVGLYSIPGGFNGGIVVVGS